MVFVTSACQLTPRQPLHGPGYQAGGVLKIFKEQQHVIVLLALLQLENGDALKRPSTSSYPATLFWPGARAHQPVQVQTD